MRNSKLTYAVSAVLLLAALPAAAANSTSTGWITAIPVPPIVHTNNAGQILLRGNAHLVRVDSTDARLSGQRLVFADGAYQADGTALIWGTAYQQVGAFDSNTNFTPNGEVWIINYHGVMQLDYSLQLSLAGYGSGGAIEGLRLEETMTRGPAKNPLDLTVPYIYQDMINPAPVNTSEVVDDFHGNTPTGWRWEGTGTYYPLLEANQQFTVRGQWSFATYAHADTYAWGVLNQGWSVPNDRTLEWRVNLVGMSDNATNAAAIVPANYARNQIYILYKGRDFVELGKWVGSGMAVFFYEKTAIKNTNVVLSLALTQEQPNLVVTARVLDKDNQEAVLYQRSVLDTPQADPTLTSAELLALSGMNLDIVPDVADAPITSGDAVCLDAWQYTDGTQPTLEVTYANLELRTYEVPQLTIARAVQVSWPAPAGAYTLEWAPTVQGPWMPVQNLAPPGLQRVTIPISGPAGFFRAVQAR